MDRDEILARVSLTDAAPQDSGVCKPSGYPATDMGLDLFFVIDHSSTSFTDQQWGLLNFWLSNLSNPVGPISDAGGSESFEGIGVGFTTYPKRTPPPQSCVDGCAMRTNCECLDDCGCVESRNSLDPLGPCRCEEWPWSCNDEHYAPTLEIAPLNVELGIALAGVGGPDGESTLGPALIASLDYQQAWELKNPGRRITQVLVMGSDWLGDQCDDLDHIPDIENLLNGTERPKTYVVVVDDSLNEDYRNLATAGRTNAPIRLLTPSVPRTSNPFADLVKRIRDQDQEGRCEYLLPPPSSDLDYDKVNLTAKSDGALFPRVRSPVECVRNGDAWYYDDPAHPKRIVACPEACQTLHTAGAFIQLGCPTVNAFDGGR